MILATAVALEPPVAVRHYESEPLKLLASLCRELQRATGDAPFFLSVRTVGKYFNVDPGTASRWLTLLRFDRVIDEVEKGTQKTGRASRFRFLGSLQPARRMTLRILVAQMVAHALPKSTVFNHFQLVEWPQNQRRARNEKTLSFPQKMRVSRE